MTNLCISEWGHLTPPKWKNSILLSLKKYKLFWIREHKLRVLKKGNFLIKIFFILLINKNGERQQEWNK